MRIEEEIRQKKFRNSHQRVAINILFTAGWLGTMMARQLRPFGITQQQYNVLRILRGQNPEPASVGLIQERMIDRSSNASRLVDKLHDKGLAVRKTCKKDRRQVDILITQKGLDLLAQLDESQDMDLNSPIKLSETEADQLSNLLDKLRGS
ncbi:MAG: MarR family winged helix-turn-helix transcriptional regulator [Bacteroidota bacterium]|jgi:DNA-binding MarR family transcriptional regulator